MNKAAKKKEMKLSNKDLILIIYMFCTFTCVFYILWDPSIPFKTGLDSLGVLITPLVMIVNGFSSGKQ